MGIGGGWSTEGVTPSPPPNNVPDGFLHCDALHLSDFGGLSFPSSPEDLLASLTPTFTVLTLDDMFAILSDFDFMAYPGLTATIFGMAGLNFITLFILGVWRGRRKYKARADADELTEEEKALAEVRAVKVEALSERGTTFAKLRLQVMEKGGASLVDEAASGVGAAWSELCPP